MKKPVELNDDGDRNQVDHLTLHVKEMMTIAFAIVTIGTAAAAGWKVSDRKFSRDSRRSAGRTFSSDKPIKNGSVKDGFGTETVDGVTYSYKIENGEAMIGVVGHGFTAAVKNEPDGVLVVPSKLGGLPVTKIGFAAFYRTKSSEIILPDSVVSLEDDAFCDAKASRIVLPSSIRSVGSAVLKDSTWFERQKDGPLYLDNILLGFKNDRHDSTEGTFSVKEGTRVIAKSVFNLTDFSEVILPDSVSYIGEDAFLGCRKLSRITIPKHLVSIGNRAFDGCEALTTDLFFPEGTREIGYHAFRECHKIEQATFPLSLEIIGKGAFDGCKFKSMTLPPVFASTNNYGKLMSWIPHTIESVKLIGEWTHIPKEMFSNQLNLKDIILAEGIKEIGYGAFRDCESLENIKIPDTVEQIGNSAFSDCKKLKSVALPAQLKCIGDSIFSRCSDLSSVIIPSGVTNIGYYAFSNCPSLKSVSIPDSVDTVTDKAFDKTCRLEKSEKRLAADRLSIVRKAEEQFAERCEVDGEMAVVEYYSVIYLLVKNTHGSDNFVIVSGVDNPNGYACSFMIFPTADSRNRWYAAVVKCSEKIKSWIRISAENKVKSVSKEMPIYTIGGSDEVSAYVNGITRGNGLSELLRKAIREPVTLSTMQSTTQLVVFTGRVEAQDDAFQRYRISIQLSCGDAFRSEVFSASGTLDEIDNSIVKWLTFANPKSLEKARATHSKKEDLFR